MRCRLLSFHRDATCRQGDNVDSQGLKSPGVKVNPHLYGLIKGGWRELGHARWDDDVRTPMCVVSIYSQFARLQSSRIRSMVGGVVVLWCGLVGLNARPCCDTSAHGWTLMCCGVA